MHTEDWKSNYQKEIQQAESARRAGNEGKARVCARRAAGHIIEEYLLRRGIKTPDFSSYDRLKLLLETDYVSEDIKQIIWHFIVRVTPEHQLPLNADLIEEVRWLRNRLLEEENY